MSKSVGVKKKSIWRDKASMELLMLCVPTLLAFTLFHYVPMIGIILPFRRFMPAKGLFGSPWVGFENFRFLFTSVELARIMAVPMLTDEPAVPCPEAFDPYAYYCTLTKMYGNGPEMDKLQKVWNQPTIKIHGEDEARHQQPASLQNLLRQRIRGRNQQQ